MRKGVLQPAELVYRRPGEQKSIPRLDLDIWDEIRRKVLREFIPAQKEQEAELVGATELAIKWLLLQINLGIAQRWQAFNEASEQHGIVLIRWILRDS